MASWRKLLKPGRPVQNLGGMDLDGATDPNVTYVQTANVGALPDLHYPAPEAGVCEPLPYSLTNPDRVIQRYTTWQSLRVFHRSRFNGVWSGWKEVGA